MTGREKWKKYLAGDYEGPMVAPLCDKWDISGIEYKWEGKGPEPYKPGDRNYNLCGQLMMAKAFGWEPLFYAGVEFLPKDKNLKVEKLSREGKTVSVIRTPKGDLTRVDVSNGITSRCEKDFLETERDYINMLWYTEQIIDFDYEGAIAQIKKIMDTVGDAGMVGTWVSPCAFTTDIQALYFHLMDFPGIFKELCEAKRKLLKAQLDVYEKAGLDFLFYCVPGTDMISPAFYREWIRDEVKENIEYWKRRGGFIVWHACGHIKAFVEDGSYNEMLPDILETLSEPPVGNLPSLGWARERLDRRIITKGNVPLDIILNGTEDDVRHAVRKVKRETAGYRHIMGFSDCILRGTPAGNLRAFVDESRKSVN